MKDIKKMNGEQLYNYYTNRNFYNKEINDYDENFAFGVSSLIYIMDIKEAYILLEEIVKNNKHFYPIYPGLGEKPTKDMQLIGSIPDGGLYIK